MDFQFLKDKEMTLSERLYPFHAGGVWPAQGKPLSERNFYSPRLLFFFFSQNKKSRADNRLDAAQRMMNYVSLKINDSRDIAGAAAVQLL